MPCIKIDKPLVVHISNVLQCGAQWLKTGDQMVASCRLIPEESQCCVLEQDTLSELHSTGSTQEDRKSSRHD